MTVRDATQRESPDGNVLYIEEVRRHLGVQTDPGEGSSPNDATKAHPEVLLIGHDMHDDFQKMDKDGIDLQRFFHYLGCVDTQVVIEDTGARMGKSLSASMSYYGLANLELKEPQCPKIPPKLAFIGAHCAGNDAVATLEVCIAQALDLSLKTRYEDLVYERNLPEDWFDNPLQGMNKNMILLAYDTEGVETPNYESRVLNRTSEHGFAWVRVADIAHIPPGEHGKNWRPYFKARHWINQDFRNFRTDDGWISARTELIQSSLIKRDIKTKHLSLHRLVQEVAQDDMSTNQIREYFVLAVELLSRAWPAQYDATSLDNEAWEASNEVVTHIVALQHVYKRHEQWEIELSEIRHFVEVLKSAAWQVFPLQSKPR